MNKILTYWFVTKYKLSIHTFLTNVNLERSVDFFSCLRTSHFYTILNTTYPFPCIYIPEPVTMYSVSLVLPRDANDGALDNNAVKEHGWLEPPTD
jgi:hypothetical protein